MSTFYLLPPRPVLGDRLALFLHGVLPGLDWDAATRVNLAEAVSAAAEAHPDVFVVYRDELPPEESTDEALAHGFGAAHGDEVVEVRAGRGAQDLVCRRWKVA